MNVDARAVFVEYQYLYRIRRDTKKSLRKNTIRKSLFQYSVNTIKRDYLHTPQRCTALMVIIRGSTDFRNLILMLN